LSPGALKLLLPDGPLRFLVSDLPLYRDDPYAFDIQLRENNTLMYYRGTTRLLSVRIHENGDIRAVTQADKAYGRYPSSKEAYAGMMREWKLEEANEMAIAFHDYLLKSAEACKNRYYGNRKEGYWQNRLCIDWGLRWQTNQQFMIIDRECVIGFDSEQEKRAFYDPLYRPYNEIRNQLQKEACKIWGKAREKPFGDELDILALDSQNNLVAIELKHGCNPGGIYWGPLQVLAYRDAFKSKLAVVTRGIKKLVEQKVLLGLLPQTALSRLPDDAFPAVKTVLVIGDPNLKSKCWDNLNRVVKELNVSKTDEDRDGLRLITLE